MTFIEETIMKNWDIWKAYKEQAFLQNIRKHKMDEAMFLHYLKEDTKYLKDYARVFGMGIFKSESMDEICLFFDMLKFVESCESAVRVNMLKDAGFDIHDIEQEAQEKETKDYTDFLLHTAKLEDTVAMLFVTLPCMLSYAYIGQELLKENPAIIEESPYGTWIQEYVCEEYLDKCRTWMKCAEEKSKNRSKEEKQHLQELFHIASVHEAKFWDMSARMERKG